MATLENLKFKTFLQYNFVAKMNTVCVWERSQMQLSMYSLSPVVDLYLLKDKRISSFVRN